MDPVADFHEMALPLLEFIVRNQGIITLVLILVGVAWTPLLADNARRPREFYRALFGKGTSKGRGDIPGGRD